MFGQAVIRTQASLHLAVSRTLKHDIARRALGGGETFGQNQTTAVGLKNLGITAGGIADVCRRI